MRAHTTASNAFDRAALDEEDEQIAAELRGFHLRDGGWKGAGWNQISWRRRKREEQRQRLINAERQRKQKEEQRRETPLGRMNDTSLSVWNGIVR